MRVLSGGERVPLLLDGRGVPLFYPTLFETSQLRNRGAAYNTIRNALEEIEVLLRWETPMERDLVAEFAAGQMLSLADIVSLRDFCGLDMRFVVASSARSSGTGNVAWLEARTAAVASLPSVSRMQQYNRMSTIADYLGFVATVVTQHRGHPEDAHAITEMVTRIRHHRPRGKEHFADDDPNAKSPPSEVIDRFMSAMAVDSPKNPFRDPTQRLRNAIIFGLLRWTGMRRGELLSLRLDQLDLGREPKVWVRRNQDDVHDLRPNQPVSKTKERPLPVPEELASQIEDYVLNVRAKVLPARKHPYLLVSHRAGTTYGRPLSASALGSQIMARARSVDPSFSQIHPHAFRHYFNYELSLKVDAHNAMVRAHSDDPAAKPITEAQELDMRAFLNGHRSLASGRFYTRRHVREEADRAARALQSETLGDRPTKDIGNE